MDDKFFIKVFVIYDNLFVYNLKIRKMTDIWKVENGNKSERS